MGLLRQVAWGSDPSFCLRRLTSQGNAFTSWVLSLGEEEWKLLSIPWPESSLPKQTCERSEPVTQMLPLFGECPRNRLEITFSHPQLPLPTPAPQLGKYLSIPDRAGWLPQEQPWTSPTKILQIWNYDGKWFRIMSPQEKKRLEFIFPTFWVLIDKKGDIYIFPLVLSVYLKFFFLWTPFHQIPFKFMNSF